MDNPGHRFRRIVLATDGSQNAQTAVSLVAALDWPEGATVAVVGVGEGLPETGESVLPPTGVGQDVQRYLALRREEDRERVTGIVADAAAILRERRPEIAVDEVVREGEPAAELLAVAAERQADLIVAGARGQTVLQGLLLGSVSEALVSEAPCPVLIARETAEPLRRVLVAAGQADDAARLARACLALPLAPGAWILAVTVAPGSRADSDARSVVDRLAEIVRRGAPDWTVETSLLAGETASALLAEAVSQAVDLIVVGARERRGLAGRLGLGSVSRKLVRRASSSVLVVRGEQGVAVE